MKLYKFYKNHFRDLIENDPPAWFTSLRSRAKAVILGIGRFLKVIFKQLLLIVRAIFVITGYILICLGLTFTGEHKRREDMYYLMERWSRETSSY